MTDHPGKALLFFALPMIFGNLFQQFYNIADSVIVGKFVGEQALAAVVTIEQIVLRQTVTTESLCDCHGGRNRKFCGNFPVFRGRKDR